MKQTSRSHETDISHEIDISHETGFIGTCLIQSLTPRLGDRKLMSLWIEQLIYHPKS